LDYWMFGFKQQKTGETKIQAAKNIYIYMKKTHKSCSSWVVWGKNMAPITKTQNGSLTSKIQNVDRKYAKGQNIMRGT
jgi:hypothetical protein